MRLGVAIGLSVASSFLGAGLVACFDLFHATDDIVTACQIDAHAQGCSTPEAASPADAAVVEAATDFCAWDASTASQNARHACAWLGACESPLGRNAFGPCMFQALLAYDCAANPSHPVRGRQHALWDCLWSAQSCTDVDHCVFPGGPEGCGSNGTACVDPPDPNGDVRIECVDGGPGRGENCALWGQSCAWDNGPAYCAGNRGSAGLACAGTFECTGSSIHYCVDAGDLGIDCSGNGAQACDSFPKPDASWVACLPEQDAAPCTPDASAQCTDGVAVSCPAAVVETIRCGALLGDAAACISGPLAPPFDWTSPCQIPSAAGGDASSCAERCSGTDLLTSCARGAAYTVSCSAEGLGPCRAVATDNGQVPGVQCTAPPP
jgi:hypothetical protein